MVVCAMQQDWGGLSREPGPYRLASLPTEYVVQQAQFSDKVGPMTIILLPSGCRCRKVAPLPLRDQNFSSHYLAPSFLAKLQPAPYLPFDVAFSTSSQQPNPHRT